MSEEGAAAPVEHARSFRPAAWRRPGMVALVYAHRAVAAVLIAGPVALVAGGVTGDYPRGDAELFDAGGRMLVEAVRLAREALVPLAAQGSAIAALATLAGLFPLAMLIVALGQPGRVTARLVAGRAAASLGTLALLWGTTLLAQAIVAVLVVVVGEKTIAHFSLGVREGDLARVAVYGLALTGVAAVGVAHDLARVAAVQDRQGMYAASSRAFDVLLRAGWRAGWAYAWRGGLALGCVAGGAWLAWRVGSHGAGALVASAVVHQASIAAAVFLRASWLATALGLVMREAPVASGWGAEEADLAVAEERDHDR